MTYVAAVSIPLVVIDVRSRRLPNVLVMPGYFVAAVTLILVAATSSEFQSSAGAPPLAVVPAALGALISAAAYGLFLWALSIAGGMGMGDVKLAGVLGAAAGLIGPTAAVLSPVLAFVLGGLVSAAILISRRGTRRTRIPFGPFMLAGFWVAVTSGLLLPT